MSSPLRRTLLVLLLSCSGCDTQVVDHTPAQNLLDADTSSMEGGVGHWQAWFATSISRSPEAARIGAAGLRIEVTAADGWGIQFDNWPGIASSPGAYHVDAWLRAVKPLDLEAKLIVRWRNEAGAELAVTALPIRTLGTEWQHVEGESQAPPGTTRLWIELQGDVGSPGDAFDVDEVFVIPVSG